MYRLGEYTPDPTRSAPVFWTEVFSRADARWLPVDPVRGLVNKRTVFDPTSTFNSPAGMRVENRMVYVVAFEEDGYARDVTPRYAREYGAKVAKMQQGGKGKKEWWESVMKMVTRPYRLVSTFSASFRTCAFYFDSDAAFLCRIGMTLKTMSCI